MPSCQYVVQLLSKLSSAPSLSSEHCLNVFTSAQQAGQSRDGISHFGGKNESYKHWCRDRGTAKSQSEVNTLELHKLARLNSLDIFVSASLMLWNLPEIHWKRREIALTKYLKMLSRGNHNNVRFMPHWAQPAQWTNYSQYIARIIDCEPQIEAPGSAAYKNHKLNKYRVPPIQQALNRILHTCYTTHFSQ